MRAAPEVITGPKSPEHYPERELEGVAVLAQRAAELNRPEPRAAGEKLYQTRIRFLRVQVKTAADRLDMATGALIRGTTVFAQFKEGEYRTSDPEIQAAIERSSSFVQGDIWDADQLRIVAAKASYEALVNNVLGDPELLEKLKGDERLKKDLNLTDFALPKAQGSSEVRPAPSSEAKK